MIPQEIIDKIVELPILEVATKLGITLKKAGVNFVTHCPSHNEKTPSFTISPSKNFCKCFGCGVGGGPLQLVTIYKKIEWIEAVKFLAHEFAIHIPKRELTKEEKTHYTDFDEITKTNELALTYFKSKLLIAEDYVNKRWKPESINLWEIGFAPDDWQGLINWGKQNNLSENQLLKARLISETNGRRFDFFRNRVIFPIRNRSNNLIGFSARTLSLDENTPKYLNTPETAAYKKGEILYGIPLAQSEIRRQDNVFIVEGNPDVIKMHQVGANNTVAPSGTSLTDEQLTTLKRLTSNITFVLETDEAGIKGVIKNAIKAIKEGFFVSLLTLPEEKDVKHDPDSFFKTKIQFLEHHEKHSQSFLLWYAKRLLIEEPNPGKRNNIVTELCELLSNLTNESVVDNHIEYLKKLEGPRTIWTKGIKAAKTRSEDDTLSKRLQDNLSKEQLEKYRFFQERNQIYFSGKNGTYKGSNFVLDPLFHVASITNSKRLYLMRNQHNHSQVIELSQDDLVTLSKFRKAVESRGNFIWMAGEIELILYKTFLYETTDTCHEITQLGWQKEGFWAWGNGIYNNAFHKTNDFGIVSHNTKNYYLPASSKIWESEKEHFTWERNFIHRHEGQITLNDYSTLFEKVYGQNGIIGLSFLFASLFRDIIVKTTTNFPLLNMFGPKGAGKSEMGISLMSFFSKNNKAPNLKNSTVPSINDAISQLSNGLCHLDEYKNDLEFTKIELLKSVYDGTGRTRLNMERDKKRETTAVDCGVIFSGQEMPTFDIALFSRVVFLAFNKTIYTEQEKKNFETLKAYDKTGLSHLTHEILSKRNHFKENWLACYNLTSTEFQNSLKEEVIEDRIFRNWLIVASAYRCLEVPLNLPFAWDNTGPIFLTLLRQQNGETKRNSELSNFWALIEYLVKDGLLENEVDFHVKTLKTIKTDRAEPKWKEPREVLILNHTKTFQLYRKHGKISTDKILPISTIQYYLTNSKEFIGIKKSQAFKNRDLNTRRLSEEFDSKTNTYKKLYQITNAYVFDYAPLNISINYVLAENEDPFENQNNEEFSHSLDLQAIDSAPY